MQISIVNLEKKYLKEVIKLVLNTFPDEDELPNKELEASIDNEKFNRYKKKSENDIRSLEYFVAIDEFDKVSGIIGLYTQDSDYYESYWVGWYCVNNTKRGLGIGNLLLQYAIKLSKERGAKYLWLYTSSDEGERKAQEIYEQNDFKIKFTEYGDDYDIYYRRKVL
ncbi:MAG: GNAT family N-acetyltransferase [Clostridium sp.]